MRPWRFKYRLSTLLAAVAVLAVLLGGYVVPVLRQKEAVLALRAKGVRVLYSCESDYGLTPGPFASIRDRVGDVIGHDWVSDVAGLDFWFIEEAVTEEDLNLTLQFPNLRMLALKDRTFGDRYMEYVVSFRDLEYLDISATAITDASSPQLAHLPRLRVLLLGRGITDHSVDDLQHLQTLERLYLIPTQITGRGAARLRTALPNCGIVH